METLKIFRAVNRNVVYLLLTIIVVGLMFITEPSAPILPHGLFLPATNQTYPSRSDDDVKLYNGNVSNAKIIGQVRVELHFDQTSENQEAEVLRYARHLAAQAGANGLAVNTFLEHLNLAWNNVISF